MSRSKRLFVVPSVDVTRIPVAVGIPAVVGIPGVVGIPATVFLPTTGFVPAVLVALGVESLLLPGRNVGVVSPFISIVSPKAFSTSVGHS